MTEGLLLLLAAMWVASWLAVTAIRRFYEPDSWWEERTMVSRNDPLGWLVRDRLRRGYDAPPRTQVAVWSLMQVLLAGIILTGGVIAYVR
jgi:hypothetical protein